MATIVGKKVVSVFDAGAAEAADVKSHLQRWWIRSYCRKSK
jgi:hypothetical protein